MNRWTVAPGRYKPEVKDLALHCRPPGETGFSLMASPVPARPLGPAHRAARPQYTYQRVGKQEHTPPQMPSVKELTDSLE
jgi:hypothetical protein